jgi:hypothetical protein
MERRVFDLKGARHAPDFLSVNQTAIGRQHPVLNIPDEIAVASSLRDAISALRSRDGGANLILLCGSKSIE